DMPSGPTDTASALRPSSATVRETMLGFEEVHCGAPSTTAGLPAAVSKATDIGSFCSSVNTALITTSVGNLGFVGPMKKRTRPSSAIVQLRSSWHFIHVGLVAPAPIVTRLEGERVHERQRRGVEPRERADAVGERPHGTAPHAPGLRR